MVTKDEARIETVTLAFAPIVDFDNNDERNKELFYCVYHY